MIYVELGDMNSKRYITSLYLETLPSIGGIINSDGTNYQVMQSVHHGKDKAHITGDAMITLYVVVLGNTSVQPTHTPEWMTDFKEARKCPTGGFSPRRLLSVSLENVRHTVTGAWDDNWSGQCWVYDTPRVPVGTVPDAWMPLPEPFGG